MSRRGLLGAVAGVAATGLAAGVAAERYAIGRYRLRPDPAAREPFGELTGAVRTVRASDGVPLHVEEVGPAGAPVTVVFVHGYVVDRRCWHYQWRDLRDLGRLICYDQRGHGLSGRGARGEATIEQLGRDLGSVLDAVAADGPVVLVGHSMGGMAVMALADARPELFGARVRGVALVSTSTGRLGELILGLPAAVSRGLRAVSPRALRLVERRAALLEHGRRLGGDLEFLATRWYAFGSAVPPSLVGFMERMIAGTRVEVMGELIPTLLDHERLAALDVLGAVETLVLVGARDRQTPPDHSRRIAAELPAAELVVLPDTGHMIMLERPQSVELLLRALVDRSSAGRPDPAAGPARRSA